MNKNLTIKQNTDLILKKSKSSLKITSNILSKRTSLIIQEDDSWIQRLWDWADNNDIPDLEWFIGRTEEENGYFRGLSRNKEELLNVTELDLHFNQLTQLPKEIGNLVNLTWLYLSDNQLTQLPKEIGNLVNLTALDLSDNQLTQLPKEIGNLVNLTWLALSDNQLTQLPKEIGNLVNLTELGLSYKQLTQLPKEIENLKDNGCHIKF